MEITKIGDFKEVMTSVRVQFVFVFGSTMLCSSVNDLIRQSVTEPEPMSPTYLNQMQYVIMIYVFTVYRWM